jgi:hypothetical protein
MTPAKLDLLSSLKAFEDDLRAAANRIRELRTDIQIEKPHESQSPTWEAFKAEEKREGHCVCCDRKLRGLRRFLCGADECARLFRAIYARGYRAQRKAAS